MPHRKDSLTARKPPRTSSQAGLTRILAATRILLVVFICANVVISKLCYAYLQNTCLSTYPLANEQFVYFVNCYNLFKDKFSQCIAYKCEGIFYSPILFLFFSQFLFFFLLLGRGKGVFVLHFFLWN